MKRFKYYILLAGALSMFSSCVEDLLDRNPTTLVSSEVYWRNTDDALNITMGVYEATRTLFGRDYYFDGQGEFQFTRGTSLGSGTWNPGGGIGSGFGYMWNNAYRVIDRTNFIIENVEKMIEKETVAGEKQKLERINGENYFLRALAYFRLIELWGDVPYFRQVLSGNDEATSLERTPIATIKDDLIKDLTYAISVLPSTLSGSERGRATQIAAYAFKGKINLY
ncbi:MAG: RagB/SusD family nutrient uptake outer membrane protein, partial [Dysgonamonadaceae bacterium]|nr:RagB/SusD family nutrient uptake outer membrane protein [Dysgonamonadaceae bacterium]